MPHQVAKRAAELIALIMLSVPVFGATAAAVEENPDVDTAAVYEYRADPEAHAINVTITVKVTADKPNRNTAAGYYQYYFEGYGLALPKAASDLTVTDESGRALDFGIEFEDEFFQTIVFSFRRNIFFGQTATAVISFNLIEDRDNEYSLVRVNDAYVGLEVWTDPTLEEAEVRVITPLGFVNSDPYQLGEGSGQFRAEVGEEEIIFVATSVDPENYWAVLSLNRPEKLVQDTLEVDGYEILFRSWPGDQAWSSEAEESIEDGLPLLLDSIGLEWPLDDELTVTESYDPTLGGYGGWYDSGAEEISVGDELDDHLMMHELSHIWFGNDMFTDRWITEGLANTYAADVVEAMGEDRPEPEPVSLVDSASIPLSTWSSRFRSPETEQWAYPASWTVTNAILEEVGKETLDAVIRHAAENTISYLGDGEPQRSVAPSNWTLYLDLLENYSGRSNEDLQDLFADWVVRDDDKDMLEDREPRRERYAALVERGDGWAAPHGLRQMMSRWSFGVADDQMDAAEQLLDRRDALIETLAPVGAELPPDLEEGYEAVLAREFDEINELFDQSETAADQLRNTHDDLEDATGVFERVGAIGTDYEADLADAAGSFSDADFDAVATQTAELDDNVDDLAETGMIRSGVVAGVFVVVGGGLAFWLVRRRRGRHERGTDLPEEFHSRLESG